MATFPWNATFQEGLEKMKALEDSYHCILPEEMPILIAIRGIRGRNLLSGSECSKERKAGEIVGTELEGK